MKYHKSLIIYASILFALTSLSSCKSNDNVNPTQKQVETLEVKTLKSYYASVAKVDITNISYDQTNDVFSINNDYKITHTELLKNYNNSLTGRIQ